MSDDTWTPADALLEDPPDPPRIWRREELDEEIRSDDAGVRSLNRTHYWFGDQQ